MTDKAPLRERVWDALEESGEARFPFPPHGRIPNFAGADDAAERLAGTEEWQAAETLKANPDAPQLPVRRAALRQGKTLYMAVPRLREERCFLRLDPTEVAEIDNATTVSGSSEAGVPVHPEEMEPVDMVVSGSVAVTEAGTRVGKGEGYSDLEFAVLRRVGLADGDTTTATTVHPLQFAEGVSADPHDVPMDLICTPERTIRTGATDKPTGIDWDALSEERVAEIPVLGRLRPE